MQLSDFVLVPALFRDNEGHLKIGSRFKYKVFGPFGTGYNIRVTGKTGTALLQFARDYLGALVETPQGKFEMSDESIFNGNGTRILQLTDQGIVSDHCDELLLALFVVNHHFWRKTGQFSRSGAASKGQTPSA
jgi:hypothetical protein